MITLAGITKQYGAGADLVTVLDGIDLEVRRGTIHAVVGPSGAGKSTLAHCVNLLERPTSGTVTIDGRELTALSARDLRVARRTIGTVFQASSLLSRRTAAQNVALPLEYLGVEPRSRAARVAELLERVGLADRADHKPHQLSGGQRQRVGIARALALRPSVLLADEATSGLDPDTTTSILGLLDELRRDLELTIVLITHEMAAVRQVADDVARLEDGRIVERGAVLDLITQPSSALGQALLPRQVDADAPVGQDVWQITYRTADVPPDWIDRVSAGVGSPASLLAASVEPVSGVRTGRVALGIDRGARDRVAELLSGLGLHGARSDDAHHDASARGAGPTSPSDAAIGATPTADPADTTREVAA